MTDVVLSPEQERLALAIADMYPSAAAARLLNEQDDDDDFAAVGRALEAPPFWRHSRCLREPAGKRRTAAILRELVPLQHAAVQAA